ncbi:MAG: thiol peroxidase [Planctomycetota bacterium]
MAEVRKGAIKFKGNPMSLVGKEVKVGDVAPAFTLTDNGMQAVTLASSAGKVRLISVVPSLDTPVCDLQTAKFNEAAAKFPANVEVLTVSLDLPFAQKRWCGAKSATHVKTLSDYKDRNFGTGWGLLIDELKLLARAVYVVDAKDKVVYAQVVSEVTEHPDYDKAVSAVQAAAK